MSESVRIAFSDKSALAGLDALAIGMTAQVRPAAQAGAQVLYEEVLLRVPVSKKPHYLKGGRIVPPGALKSAIYQAFSKDNSAQLLATYHISWNAKKAPHGHLVENGTSRAAATPFLRPAYDAKAGAALEAARDRVVTGGREVIERLQK
jgi:HK97 gp10 family phage protein